MSDGLWRETYFDRVRPVVGETLARARAVFWDLGHGYLAAEALARTGLRRQLWLDDARPEGAFVRSLGRWATGHGRRGEALAAACREHNTFESEWELVTRPDSLEELHRALDERPDVLVARGDERARDVAAAAIAAGTPLVMTFVPAPALGALHIVWIPGTACPADRVLEACGRLAELPSLDLDQPAAHIDGLEARSGALALASWILLGASRPDLERPLVAEGRVILARGRPDWPWAVRFLAPAELDGLLARARPRYNAPLALLRDPRLLVIGLGTASLFCAEAAGLLARQLIVVDAKAVSPYNPVRQVYSTRDIGDPKANALARILTQRLDPAADWQTSNEGPVSWRTSGSFRLGAAQLHLTAADPGAEEQLIELLDVARPTLAIVGMGRTHDDNFMVTAELRRRGIRHITPSAFPGVTHYKHIVTDGASGPCYDCLQGHLVVDAGPGPTLTEAQRELFYGGTQPATLAETYPSAHSLLRLAQDLAMPRGARPAYLAAELAAERACFVGSNRAERAVDGQWLYGVDQPFSMVAFGLEDLVVGTGAERPCSCGRVNLREK